MAQQHGQYQPGQYGLNAGIMPDPGFTYGDYNLNFNADQLTLENGTPVKGTGTYNIWAVENFFFYVPKFKILGAKFAPFVAFPTIGTGSLVLTVRGEWQDSWIRGLRSCGYVVSIGKSSLARSAGRLVGGICLCGAHRPLLAGRYE